MFENFKVNLEANSSYYSEEAIVEFFQITTEGLTQECEHCENYPVVSSIAEFTRQVSSILGSMQGTNNPYFIYSFSCRNYRNKITF